MTALSLETVFSRLGRLPTPPALLLDLLSEFQAGTPDINELVRKIGKDPALSATLLRLANSTFYGHAGRISSLHRAAIVLGTRTLEAMAVAACVSRQFAKLGGLATDWSRFWRHSFATAICARDLAVLSGHDPELAFVSGLLHDIGRLLLGSLFSTEYEQVVAHKIKLGISLLDAEREVLGIDHAEVGATLLQRWGVPQAIVATVAKHHEPASDEITHFVDLIIVANLLMRDPDLPDVALAERLTAGGGGTLNVDQLRASLNAAVEGARELATQLAPEPSTDLNSIQNLQQAMAEKKPRP